MFPAAYTRSGPLRLLATCGEKTPKKESFVALQHNTTRISWRSVPPWCRLSITRGGTERTVRGLTWSSSDPGGWHWEHKKQKPWRRCPSRSVEPTAEACSVNHSGGATRVTWMRRERRTRRVLRTQAAPPPLPPTPSSAPPAFHFQLSSLSLALATSDMSPSPSLLRAANKVSPLRLTSER